MEWTDIRLTVAKADAENAEAVATLIAEGGIYIEDYSDIEQQVAEIAHVDLIEQELLDKPRDTVIIHLYLEPGASQVETLALIAARMEAAGIPYTVETEGVEQEDWQNGWRKYYHPMTIQNILTGNQGKTYRLALSCTFLPFRRGQQNLILLSQTEINNQVGLAKAGH